MVKEVVDMRFRKLIALAMAVIMLAGTGAAASNAEIGIYIDYVNESIRLSGINRGGTVRYMYSPNVSAGAERATRRQAAERWFPLYGDEINISQFIPDGDRNGFIFAFRDADDVAGSDGAFRSRRTSTIIRGRPIISNAEFRSAVRYNPRTERIEIDRAFGRYDYQVGLGMWLLNNSAPFIEASSRHNPLGGVFMIRASAVAGERFASNEFRVRVPRAPAAPRVRFNERTGRLAGVQANMQWSASVTGRFTNFEDRSGNIDAFRSQLGAFRTERDADGNESLIIYVRLAATDRHPSSLPQRLLLDRSLFD